MKRAEGEKISPKAARKGTTPKRPPKPGTDAAPSPTNVGSAPPPGRARAYGRTSSAVSRTEAETVDGGLEAAAVEMDMDMEPILDPEEQVDARYQLWLQNAMIMYDFCTTHVLEWPAAALAFLEGSRKEIPGRNFSVQQLAFGTTCPGVNYLNVYNMFLPCVPEDAEEFDPDELETFASFSGTFTEVQAIAQRYCRVVHEGPVTRIRSMPQKSSVLATRGPSSYVYLYDVSRRRAEPEDTVTRPDMRLKGHGDEGKALDWHRCLSGYLATGAGDGAVHIYDVQSCVDLMGTRDSVDVGPVMKLKAHQGEVLGVTWHPTHHDVLASVGEDRSLNMWDMRSSTPQETETIHRAAINDIQFHPNAAFLFATCSADTSVRVWDLRKLRQPLMELVSHLRAVNGLQWAPFNDVNLLSYSADRSVICWDISKVGTAKIAEQDDCAPPELVFQHLGHTANVRDAAWCPHEEDEWSVASVDDNNVLQLWAPNERIYNDEADLEVYNTEVV